MFELHKLLNGRVGKSKMKFHLLFWIFSVLILTACGGRAEPAVVGTLPAEFAGKTNPLGAEAASPGAEIFKNNCVACHGDLGHGDGPAGLMLEPKPTNLTALAATVGDDYLFWRVSMGKLGTSMVGWKGVLTDEQIWQVVTFIRTLK
jgi:high-affinity iron transporter